MKASLAIPLFGLAALVAVTALLLFFLRHRRHLAALQVVSRATENNQELLFGLMATREDRPWLFAELEVLVPLAPALIRTMLSQALVNPLTRVVTREYMSHPVTGREVEVYRLTTRGLRLYPPVDPLARSWQEAADLAQARERTRARVARRDQPSPAVQRLRDRQRGPRP